MSYAAVPLRLEEHRKELVRLWTEDMGDPRIADVVDERMRWLYDENPYGATRTFLTVQSPGDGVVGCGSFYPRDTFVRGRRVKAAILCEFAVHKDHRVAGAAVTVQRAVASESAAHGVEMLYGYPNKGGIQVFQRVGHKIIGEVANWAKPLRSAYKLREFVHSSPLAKAAGALVDALFWTDDARRLVRDPFAYTTEIVRAADGRFDELWQRAQPTPYIMGERSSAYLNWRYASFKTAEHRFFCLIERRTRRLAGYVAYVIEERKVTVADMFSHDLERVTTPLLLRFALRMRLAGMNFISLSYVGNPFFEKQLEALNFMRASGSRPLVVYTKGVAEDLKDEIMNKDRWFMIDGELDI
jgi:Acetyltransferase (GNAT) domain